MQPPHTRCANLGAAVTNDSSWHEREVMRSGRSRSHSAETAHLVFTLYSPRCKLTEHLNNRIRSELAQLLRESVDDTVGTRAC